MFKRYPTPQTVWMSCGFEGGVLQRGLELRRHEVNGVARGLELVLLRIGDGVVQIAALYALHPRDEHVQRL